MSESKEIHTLYQQRVRNQEKYAPVPPPFIDLNPETPIAWSLRPATWSYDEYKGGFGPHQFSIQVEPISRPPGANVGFELETQPDLAGIQAQWLLPDVIQKNYSGLFFWILAYLLQPLDLSLGLFYLDKIAKEGATYPEIIQSAASSKKSVGELATSLGLYLPKSILGETSKLNEFFATSLYWMRKFRSERARLNDLLGKITHTDLYLVTGNPYEHYPGRKLLSYYDDSELYQQFGRIGNKFFPKEYSSKRDQLDGLVAFGLDHFGEIRILSWSRPIRLMYRSQSLTLDNLDSIPKLAILRLGIMVQSAWPTIQDKESWTPLLDLLEEESAAFYSAYLSAKEQDLSLKSFGEKMVISLPAPVEEDPSPCLICRRVYPESDFSLCGHPTCLTCQALLGSSKCPFCTEHFTADGISNEFLRSVQRPIPSYLPLKERIKEINLQKQDRLFKFDWANLQITLFGMK